MSGKVIDVREGKEHTVTVVDKGTSYLPDNFGEHSYAVRVDGESVAIYEGDGARERAIAKMEEIEKK